MRTQMLILTMVLVGCRDTLEGTWEGDLECQGTEYEVEAEFTEDSRFDYSGDMVFSFERDATFSGESVVFKADLQYDFTTSQTSITGGQDIYLDMVWTKLYCEIEYPDGEVVEGGCKNVGGIDDSDKGEAVGMVEMRYSGSDRISIDDDNCEGTLYLD